MSTPVLHLLAGPNGAGKSTFVERVLQLATHLPFINADHIAAARWPGDEEAHAYDASQAAATERAALLAARQSFISETVFSHDSKVALVENATAHGYVVDLHVIVVPVELTVARVAERVRRGGHSVPDRKIRERYQRLWPLVAAARTTAERTTLYDNSTAHDPFRVFATYRCGELDGSGEWPAWAPPELR